MDRAGNLAYDFSRFENTEEKREKIASKKAEIKMVKSEKRMLKPAKVLTGFVVVLLIAAAMIYNQVVLTELNDKEAQLNKSMSAIENDNARKQTQLETKMSPKNIEDYAVNTLGLVKLDQAKIKYVNISQKNKIEVKKPANENVFDKIKDTFSKFVE